MNKSPHKHEISNKSSLLLAIIINILLTVFQIVGGIFSGSLALVADALHNLSDALALGIAWIARLIAQKPSDEYYTYGYGRAELIGAMINLTSLIIIGMYLIYEGIYRLIDPVEVQGMLVVYIAIIALVIDLATALLVYRDSKNSLNMKAAFLHNISDGLASIGVIISGLLIANYNLYFADAIITLLISLFVLYQGISTIPKVIRILMQATPLNIDLNAITQNIKQVKGVQDFHHVHAWQLDEDSILLEAHVIVEISLLADISKIKYQIKKLLKNKYSISHSTIEFELHDGACETDLS
tara:strand:- start:2577 stop:3470 length:894 start_codon:yes stop_codon:yes gene_type:complete